MEQCVGKKLQRTNCLLAPGKTDVMGPNGSEMKLKEMFLFCVESKGYFDLHLGCSFLSQSSRNNSLMPRMLSCLLK